MTPDSSRIHQQRKDDHLDLADKQQLAGARRNDFDDVEFLHHALGAIDAADIDLSVHVDDFVWNAPVYINGMTGGTERTEHINRALAIAAANTGVAIASGSMSIALKHPETAEGFRVLRRENPNGFVMANLGADKSVDDARRVIDLIEANAIQLHLNAVQETVMPEGDRDFSHWARSIEQIVAGVDVPVVVKEVGFGLSRRTQQTLAELGVRIADVSGKGGTDFVDIENSRREKQDFEYMRGFGQSAVACLLDAPENPDLSRLASGGIRSPLDVVKVLALGARAAGVAGTFLRFANAGGADALTPVIEEWLDQLRQLLVLLGARTPADLMRTDVLLRGEVREFCQLRGIDAGGYSARSVSS